MSTIGQRFKKIRIAKNQSQTEFGDDLGMSKSGISAVENDKVFVSADVLRTLYFDSNVNLNWFVSGEGQMFNAPKFEDVEDAMEAKVLSILRKQGVIE